MMIVKNINLFPFYRHDNNVTRYMQSCIPPFVFQDYTSATRDSNHLFYTLQLYLLVVIIVYCLVIVHKLLLYE